jgi:hypothetical protein
LEGLKGRGAREEGERQRERPREKGLPDKIDLFERI